MPFPLRRTTPTPKTVDQLGSVLSPSEKPPSLGDREPGQAALLEKLQEEQEKQQKEEFRKRMENEVSDVFRHSGRSRKTRSRMEERSTRRGGGGRPDSLLLRGRR